MPMLPEVSILCWDAVYNNPTISFWDMLPATSKFAAIHILSQKSTHCKQDTTIQFWKTLFQYGTSIPRPFLGIVAALDLPQSSGKNLSSRGGGEKINLPTTVTVDGPWCFCWSVMRTSRFSRFWKISLNKRKTTCSMSLVQNKWVNYC